MIDLRKLFQRNKDGKVEITEAERTTLIEQLQAMFLTHYMTKYGTMPRWGGRHEKERRRRQIAVGFIRASR